MGNPSGGPYTGMPIYQGIPLIYSPHPNNQQGPPYPMQCDSLHRTDTPDHQFGATRPLMDYSPVASSESLPRMWNTSSASRDRVDDYDRTPNAGFVTTPQQTLDDGGTSTGKYECQYCGKGFTRPSSLKAYFFSFLLQTHLFWYFNRRISTVTLERNVRMPICQLETAMLKNIVLAFVCPVEGCGRSFSVLSNMRRHARVHPNLSLDSTSDEMSGPSTPKFPNSFSIEASLPPDHRS